MGRVYKALVKADRWNEASQPIGRAPVDYVEDEEIAEALAEIEQKLFAAAGPSEELDSRPFVSANIPAPAPGGSHSSETKGQRSHYPRAVDARSNEPMFGPPAGKPEPQPFVEPSHCVSLNAARVATHLSAVRETDVLASERFRTLAVKILNIGARRKLKTLVITSAEPGEGKSTVAASLAWVLAKRPARRVLLIDGVLREPSVAPMLGVATRGGWRDLVDGEDSTANAVVRIDPNGLYVLPPSAHKAAGSTSSTSQTDAIVSLNFEQFLVRVEDQFDLVVIDAPPLLDSADAQRLAALADGTILVVRAGHTHHNQVTDALKLIPKDRRLGIVLNESEAESPEKSRQQLGRSITGRHLRR